MVAVGRFNGVWKSRFRCIDKSGGTLQYKPNKCVDIIASTAVLHQICMKYNIPFPTEDDMQAANGNDLGGNDAANDYRGDQGIDGRRARQRLIESKFTR